ncbi:hypothetical protein SKP52_11725 [Sphingopyxis fribergensis]|uniref:Uncharacterized protein n=1 Tax=Sphingopyxis fribergensis TaxID=1515612 RepID=A0A0A7PMY0_9SPHN|nr:hypothetical protein SKP52_11725 [Sphingopyxis fribergensis]
MPDLLGRERQDGAFLQRVEGFARLLPSLRDQAQLRAIVAPVYFLLKLGEAVDGRSQPGNAAYDGFYGVLDGRRFGFGLGCVFGHPASLHTDSQAT